MRSSATCLARNRPCCFPPRRPSKSWDFQNTRQQYYCQRRSGFIVVCLSRIQNSVIESFATRFFLISWLPCSYVCCYFIYLSRFRLCYLIWYADYLLVTWIHCGSPLLWWRLVKRPLHVVSLSPITLMFVFDYSMTCLSVNYHFRQNAQSSDLLITMIGKA